MDGFNRNTAYRYLLFCFGTFVILFVVSSYSKQHLTVSWSGRNILSRTARAGQGISQITEINSDHVRETISHPATFVLANMSEYIARSDSSDESFVDCQGSGYLDAQSYPLVDAHSLFCGRIVRSRTDRAVYYLHGIVALTFTENCPDFQACANVLKLPGNYLIYFKAASQTVGSIFPAASDIYLTQTGTTQLVKLSRKFKATNFYFLPSVLSEKKTVLALLRSIANKCSQTQCKRMYEWTLAALQSYTRHNLGKYSKDAEEEAYQDLSLIMELLQQVLSKDFIDFDDSGPEAQTEVVITPSANEVSPADVVLYGLEIVLPQMNSQLLLYPSLCSQYYKLVTFLCEIYPEKIETLSQPMLSAFVHSLQLGLSSYGIDNCKLCLEALESLAGQCLKTRNQTTELHKAVVSFGKFVFDTLIVHSTQHELLRTAGETFYSLLCLQPQEIMLVFNQVVESQTDPNYKQRLTNSFHKLVPDVNQLIPDRTHRSEFLKNMESNIFDLRGILCIK